MWRDWRRVCEGGGRERTGLAQHRASDAAAREAVGDDACDGRAQGNCSALPRAGGSGLGPPPVALALRPVPAALLSARPAHTVPTSVPFPRDQYIQVLVYFGA